MKTRYSKYRKVILLLMFISLLFILKTNTFMNKTKQKLNPMNEIERVQTMCGELCKTSRVGHPGLFFQKPPKNIDSCSEAVHIISAVAQAKRDSDLIEFVVLNVLDGSVRSNFDCCIYGDAKLSFHRVKAVVKETYPQKRRVVSLKARQYQCFVHNISFLMKHIQLVGKKEFCNSSHIRQPVLYAPVKENKFAICAKIAYNYLNPLHIIEWFEYQKMMGVDTVLIALQQVNEDAYAVLKYYEREGIAILISFPCKLPGNIDRNFEPHKWNYHQSTHDEQVAVYSCKEILKGFGFVAVVDLDEYIVHKNFSRYTEMFKSELLPAFPDAAAFTLRVSFFITDWGVSGVEPLLTSKYIRGSKPIFNRFKTIYMPNRTATVDTHVVWPIKGYRRIMLRSHNVILYHYRKCKNSGNTTDVCMTFAKHGDTKMMNIMFELYDKVVAVKRRCGISA
ncbi:uncharacterized protein LOC143085119 isoform X1 [Mytilus galloprovincialis]|uniref:uncharacterized protein LOC143085119 isoform X1 n=1 Tax=Mytilus galloprovincialis TaxID=29158 RepID=UPI003F7B686E